MRFQLYLLVNPDGANRYPYVGMQESSERLIQISNGQISIVDKQASAFFEQDYMPTSRWLDFDLEQLDRNVQSYIGPFEYDILVHFNEEKHIVLTYHSPTNEAPKSYDIFDGYPEARARKLVDELYPVFLAARESVEMVDT
jgi:hypothetical protein